MNELNTRDVPGTEFSLPFLQGMVNRMGMSFFKYGAVAEAYPHKLDAIGSGLMRIARYLGAERFRTVCEQTLAALPAVQASPHRRDSGNTEYLMDASNFLMIEHMHPKHPDAYFEATDSDQSPGRMGASGQSVGQTANTLGRENVRLGGSNRTTKGGFYKNEGD